MPSCPPRFALVCACLAAEFPALLVAQDSALVGRMVQVSSQPALEGSSSKLKGHLVRVGPDSATIRSSGGEQTVALAEVVELKVGRMKRQTVTGATLGLLIAWVATTSQAEPNPAMAIGGAAIGAVLGSLIRLPQYKRVPISQLRPEPLPGTIVRVERPGGGQVTGVLREASAEQVTIETSDHQRMTIPRLEVKTIAWRSGKASPSIAPPIALGAIGLIVGLAAAPDCQPEEWFCPTPLGTGLAGFGIGAATGLVISLAIPKSWRWEAGAAPPRLTLRPGPEGRLLVGVGQAIRFR